MTNLVSRQPVRPAAAPGHHLSIVVVDQRLTEDGGSRSTIRLVDHWRRAGERVELFVLRRAAADNAAPTPAGMEITYPTRRDPQMRWLLPVALARLVAAARRADVVVSSKEIGWGLLLGWAAARLARRPFVIVVRAEPAGAMLNWTAPRLRPVMRRAYREAAQLVCITPGLVPAVLALDVAPQRVSVAVNGVEVERILDTRRRPAPQLPAGEGPLVVGLGRLQSQKGFDVLIRAHAAVVASGRPHRLLVLGEGRDRAELEALAEELGVAGSVHLPGFSADPLPTLAAADLFVLSSRYEGFGQCLAEALVLGVPTIATDCVSGPRLLLADGAHGDLVPCEDVDALSRAISAHLDDPARLQEAAELGSRWAGAHLTIGRAAGDVLDVLQRVAA